VSQTDGFCFTCHKDASSYQSGGILKNRSYSFRAGGWTSDPVDDILESFSFSLPDSSHSLDDIKTFITGKWEYTSDSNPCNACHNPHAAQGDPPNAENSAKTSGTRGWPVSRPSQHSSDNNAWGLWGDGSGEKMSDYTGNYQAPLRSALPDKYEPDGSTTTSDGSNLTDYVTFCTDCHNNTNTINSTILGRNLYTFNWNVDKHGIGAASDACDDIFLPYLQASCGTYVLACTDCHEPHGSPNIFLIRRFVNSGTVTVDSNTGAGPWDQPNTEWANLCVRCHNIEIGIAPHSHPPYVPPDTSGCSSDACHYEVDEFRPCNECHYHGNSDIDGVSYGEQLF
jgi:hypothetical protein